MIAGFEQPSEGEIRIDGDDVAGCRRTSGRPTPSSRATRSSPPERRGQRRLRAEAQGVGKARSASGSRPSSSGSASRARPSRRPPALRRPAAARRPGRALVNLPRCCCSTSRSARLDLKLRKGLQVELKRIQREVGITFVYVTHDQEEALTMSDRIAVMNRGRSSRSATPRRSTSAATTFVAGFIGVSNLMPAWSPAPARYASTAGPCRCRRDGLSAGERCHAVVRPEKLRIDARPGRRAAERLPAVEGIVESSLYLGTATQIVVDLGEDVRMTVLVPNADEAERQRLPGGGARCR
jgi:spermidine/putrescine transport system ATP-binding protein